MAAHQMHRQGYDALRHSPHHGGFGMHRGGPVPPGLHNVGYSSPRHHAQAAPVGYTDYEYAWRHQQQQQQQQQQHQQQHHHHHHHPNMHHQPRAHHQRDHSIGHMRFFDSPSMHAQAVPPPPPPAHMYGNSPRLVLHAPGMAYGGMMDSPMQRPQSTSPRSRQQMSQQGPPSPRRQRGLNPAALDYRMQQRGYPMGSPPPGVGGVGMGMNGMGGGVKAGIGGAMGPEMGLYAPAPPGVLEFEAVSRLLVANIKVGAVIGKGGSIVRQIREASGAKVTISDACSALHDDALEDRTITCAGPFAAVGAAFGMILSHCGVVGFGDPLSVEAVGGGGGPDGLPHVCRLLVPNSKAGGLIGRGGATIKAIREHSGARIEISSQAYGAPPLTPGGSGAGTPTMMGMGGGISPAAAAAAAAAAAGGGDRVVTITGTFDACLRAHHLIISRIMDMGQMLPGNSPPISPRLGLYPTSSDAARPLDEPSPLSEPLSLLGPSPPPLTLPSRSPALADVPPGGSPALAAQQSRQLQPPAELHEQTESAQAQLQSQRSTPTSQQQQPPLPPPPPGIQAQEPPAAAARPQKPPPLALGSMDSPSNSNDNGRLVKQSPSPASNVFNMSTMSLTPTSSADTVVGHAPVDGSVPAQQPASAGTPAAETQPQLQPTQVSSPEGAASPHVSAESATFDYLASLSDFFGGSSSKPRGVKSGNMPTSPSVTKLTIKLRRPAMSALGGTGLSDIGKLSGALLEPWGGTNLDSYNSHTGSDAPSASMRKSRAWSADTERSCEPCEDAESPATLSTTDASSVARAVSEEDGAVELCITGTAEEVQLAQLMINLRVCGGSPHHG